MLLSYKLSNIGLSFAHYTRTYENIACVLCYWKLAENAQSYTRSILEDCLGLASIYFCKWHVIRTLKRRSIFFVALPDLTAANLRFCQTILYYNYNYNRPLMQKLFSAYLLKLLIQNPSWIRTLFFKNGSFLIFKGFFNLD